MQFIVWELQAELQEMCEKDFVGPIKEVFSADPHFVFEEKFHVAQRHRPYTRREGVQFKVRTARAVVSSGREAPHPVSVGLSVGLLNPGAGVSGVLPKETLYIKTYTILLSN